MAKSIADIALSKPALEALGRVTYESGHLEHRIQTSIWGLLGLDTDTGRIITTHLTTPIRLHMLRALAHEKFDGAFRERLLKRVLKRVETAQTKRNTLVHGYLALREGPKTLALTIKARGRLTVEGVIYTAKKINDLADELATATNLLTLFANRYIWLPESLQQRPSHKKP